MMALLNQAPVRLGKGPDAEPPVLMCGAVAIKVCSSRKSIFAPKKKRLAHGFTCVVQVRTHCRFL
jgi:hypothetical protein